ncbi:MAG: SMI1/KNR4 family protein [Planctomycetota bacterium]
MKWGTVIGSAVKCVVTLLVASMAFLPVVGSLLFPDVEFEWAIVCIPCLVAAIIVLIAYFLLQGPISFLDRPSPEEARAWHEAWRKSVLAPRIEELGTHFGRPAPAELVWLYGNQSLLLQEDFELADSAAPDDADAGWYISNFLPAAKATVDDCPWDIGEHAFPFAKDLMGNYYYVEFGEREVEGSAVYFFGHDTGVEKVADSLREFLGRPILHDEQ